MQEIQSTEFNKLEYARQYRKQYREKIRLAKRLYYLKNKEKIQQQSKSWYLNNKEKAIELTRTRYRTHTQEIKEWQKNWRRDQRRSNPDFKVKEYLRCRLWNALNAQKTNKTKKTFELLGCTVSDLKAYLESKFLEGMSWDNYGEWHVDHIRPCASFNLTDPIEQKKCFHYTNLQPLWALDNMKKCAKLSNST